MFGCIDPSRSGAAREYAIVKDEELVRGPGRLTWMDVAATPLGALTAWQGLFDQGGLERDGMKGGSGGRKGCW